MEKIQTIEKLFYDITNFSYLLIPLAILLFHSSKSDMKTPYAILIYAIVCFFCLFYFHELSPKLRKYYYTLYTTFEYSAFAFLLYKFIKNKKAKSIILILSSLFFVFQIIFLFVSKKYRLDSIPIGVETILIFSFIIYKFFELSKNIDGTVISSNYIFWVAVGILIYLGGSFFFYILINHLNEEQIQIFGILANLTEILKNIVFAIALYIYFKYSTKPTASQNNIPYLDIM